MVIYLDVLVIENMLVNFFLLYITAQTLKVYIKLKFFFLSAFLGSLYVLTVVYSVPKILVSLPFKIFVALFMLFICFRIRNIFFYIKALSIFIMYSMLLAGFCIFIEINNSGNLTFNDKMLDFSYTGILTAALPLYVIIHRLVVYIKDRREITKLIYDVDIIVDNKIRRVKAFLDTGNELREPATNLPVMIVERYILKDIDIKKNQMFYIPYKVVDGSKGILVGFKPSSVNIYCEDTFSSKQLIVAFSDTKLSELNDFNALLSRGII